MTLDVQVITMGSMILSGIYLGIVLETYRRFSVWWRNITFLKYLFEICFWLSQTVILFFILFKVNYGEFRFYILLAVLLGFSMYVVLFKKVYVWFLEKLIHIVSTIIKWLVYIINLFVIQPIIWIINVFINVIQFIWKCGYSVFLFILNVLLLPIKLIIIALIFILPKKWLENYSQFSSKCSTIVNNYLLKIRQFLKKGG